MQTTNNKIKLFFQWGFSAITAGWLYYHLIDNFIIWNKTDFDDCIAKLPEYLSSSRFAIGIIFTICTFLLFYRGLEWIFKKIFDRRIENFYQKFFNNLSKEKKEKYIKWIIWAMNTNFKIRGVLPKPKEHESLNNELFTLYIHFSMLIHFILCLIILNVRFSTILIPFAVLFFLIISLMRPIAKHFIYLFEIGEIKPEQIQSDNS